MFKNTKYYIKYIIEKGKDYIAFVEGVYYKVNNAIIYRIKEREVILRNTWTGKEKILKKCLDKKEALMFIKDFIKKGYTRI